MGVSIHAYSNMRLTEPHKWSEDCEDADHVEAFVLTGFEQSLRGLADRRCYEPTSETEHARIGDWPYSGYNRWRETLCRSLHGFEPEVIWGDPDKYRHLPCFELIHFADNEGCIGPEAAADLRDDFAEFADPLAALERYDDWLAGLDLAANGGLVTFR